MSIFIKKLGQTKDLFFLYLNFRWQIQAGTSSISEPSGTMLAKDAGRHRCVWLQTENCNYIDAAVDLMCSCALSVLWWPFFVFIRPRSYDTQDSGVFDSFSSLMFCFLSIFSFPFPQFFQSLKLFLLTQHQAVSRGLDICWLLIFFCFVHRLCKA